MIRQHQNNTISMSIASRYWRPAAVVGLLSALLVPPSQAIEVIYTDLLTTQVTTGHTLAELEFENPLEGDESVLGHHVWEWLDADYHGSGNYEDWVGNDPIIDGCDTEVWLREAGHSITTTSTTPGKIVSIHLNGDDNDGLVDIYVDSSLRATLDMGTIGGSDRACVYVDHLLYDTHTIEVIAQGVGQHGGDDVAVLGAAVLADSGICCLPGGDNCADLQEPDCQAQGGTFWGEGTFCPWIEWGATSTVACEGDYAEIAIRIHHNLESPQIDFQWYHDGNPVGGNSNRLVFNSVTLSDAGDYYCEVQYPCGMLTSDIGTLEVLENVDILEQPVETFGCIGEPVSFDVLAAGLEPLEYQWYFNGDPIPDANQSLFEILEVAPEDAGSYHVTVTQADGCSRDSDPVSMSVYDVPQFTEQPLSQYVLEDDPFSFSVEFFPEPDYTLVWRLDGQEIVGAVEETYEIAAATSADAGVYDVFANNQCGDNYSDPATLTVRYPKWLQRPTENPQYPGYFYGWNEPTRDDIGPIACDDWLCVDDRSITSVHWWGSYTNGWMEEYLPALPVAGFVIGIWTDVPAGVDRPWSHPGTMLKRWEMPVDQLQERHVGVDYHPDHGYEACFRYDFYAEDGDFFTQDPNSQDIYWVSISPTYECPCNGDVNQDGYVDNYDMNPFLACQGQAPTGDCAYADINCDGVVDEDDYDPFVCLISGGQDCCPSTDPPVSYYPWGIKTRQPAWNDAAVMLTAPVAPAVGAQFGDGAPIETYEGQWDLAFILSSDLESTPQTCCIPGVGCIEIEPEECVAQGGQPMGVGTTCAEVLPAITQQPEPLTVPENRPAALSVTATGAAPLSYQWRLDGSDIPDANEATYTVALMSAEHVGSYDVIVSNDCGTIVSDAVMLNMWPVGDLNCDGTVDNFDIDPFVLALTATPPSYSEYYDEHPDCDIMLADANGDDTVNNFDIDPFVELLTGG